ncbi:MAG: hypothetical protein IJW78_06000, partial [Clostridia bacterium]|nr:hypothetical protein [Clostridia bacterium]
SILLRKWWIILISAIVFGAGAFLYCELAVTPQYTASGSTVISSGTSILNTEEGTSMKTSDVSITLALSNSFVDILSSRDLYEQIADKYDFGYSATQLKKMTQVTVRDDSLVVDVTVKSSNAEDATHIVNAVLDESPEYMKSKMPAAVIVPLDRAEGATQSYPRTAFSAILYALIGALISAFIIFLSNYFDTTIKGEEDIARSFGLSILGSIPDFTDANTAYEYRIKNV